MPSGSLLCHHLILLCALILACPLEVSAQAIDLVPAINDSFGAGLLLAPWDTSPGGTLKIFGAGVTNTSTSAAGAFTSGVYLSADAIINTSDYRIQTLSI